MKENIHPSYGPATIHCACGHVIETRSTHAGIIQVEICSACHPFFTGKQKLIDTAGRIDRFTKKYGGQVVMGTQKKIKKPRPVEPPAAKEPEERKAPTTLKEKFKKA